MLDLLFWLFRTYPARLQCWTLEHLFGLTLLKVLNTLPSDPNLMMVDSIALILTRVLKSGTEDQDGSQEFHWHRVASAQPAMIFAVNTHARLQLLSSVMSICMDNRRFVLVHAAIFSVNFRVIIKYTALSF